MKYRYNHESSGRVEDSRKYKHLLFIHYGVDDAGLTQAEFRVYAHLIRRAGTDDHAYPGIDSVAKNCLMSKTTAIKAIRSLEKLGMIRADRKVGERTVYYIEDEKNWVNPPTVHSRERSSSNRGTLPYHSRERKNTTKKDTTSKNKEEVIFIDDCEPPF